MHRKINGQNQHVNRANLHFRSELPKYSQCIPADSSFSLDVDSSLLYHGLHGDYSVLLGGNWRYELMVDSQTGLCTQMQSFLRGMQVTIAHLDVPASAAKDLYLDADVPLEPGGGCHYLPFADMAYWDEEKKNLCFGNPDADGEAVAFTPKTIAIIHDGQLQCVYLLLGDVQREISFF